MRKLEYAGNRQTKTRRTHKISVVILAVLIAGITFVVMHRQATAPEPRAPVQTSTNMPKTDMGRKGFKTFSGKEFARLYDSFVYPNTLMINEDTPITGNAEADSKLRELAEKRGYKLRSAPVTDTFVEIQTDMLLQRLAALDWTKLNNRAKKAGLNLLLTDAYRSAKDQRAIFLQRIKSIPVESIASGEADARINGVLATTALPGYSRHHTGYSVDIACKNDPAVKFEDSKCFLWLSKNNYSNAKKSGWIPSYPEGAGRQGPDPEAWEYVWVGTDALK
ncbi:MAG TPA: D-alanyl-D-alanine carboxypeptidase family protein [Candidatus Saccharimonadales bacterium]|nr:D-alanyl-D-alanine carboxypeptidase family protein [Candidatus Saccharimonadales bacterium]